MVELPTWDSLPEAQDRLRNLISSQTSDAADTAGAGDMVGMNMARETFRVNPPAPAEIVSIPTTSRTAPENVWNEWEYVVPAPARGQGE